MSSRLRHLPMLLLLLAGCAEPLRLPHDARPDLAQRWVAGNEQYAWPPADGFAAAPVLLILPPGTLIDRYGGATGNFFSPRGASYEARALPYVCAERSRQYHVYQVAKPLPVWAGPAAPWFDEPGGATQFKTDARAQMLLDDGSIVELTPPPAPAPCQGPHG